MSLRDSIGRPTPAVTDTPVLTPPAPPAGTGQAALERRRDELAEQVAELHWDLGGLAYEMAIRDHFRLDVLVRRAAMLQERDAELAQVERMLYSQETGSAGNCAECGALRGRGAVFCWQCGTALMRHAPPDGEEQAAALTRCTAPATVASCDSRAGPGPVAQRARTDGLSRPEPYEIAVPSATVER